MTEVMVSTWRCFYCDAGGTGGQVEMNKAADKHTTKESHATSCETKLVQV